MRGESMKGKSKKSTYSTTFGVDPKNQPIPQPLVLTQLPKLQIEGLGSMRRLSLKSTLFGVDPPIPQPLVLTPKKRRLKTDANG